MTFSISCDYIQSVACVTFSISYAVIFVELPMFTPLTFVLPGEMKISLSLFSSFLEKALFEIYLYKNIEYTHGFRQVWGKCAWNFDQSV